MTLFDFIPGPMRLLSSSAELLSAPLSFNLLSVTFEQESLNLKEVIVKTKLRVGSIEDERGKVVIIEEPHGLIIHKEWPSLAEVIQIASQQFPQIPLERLTLSFYSDSRVNSYLQLYKRG